MLTLLATLIAIQSVATTIRYVARSQEQQRSFAGTTVVGTIGLTGLLWWYRFEQTPQVTGWTFNLLAALIAIGISALLMLFEIVRRKSMAGSRHLKSPGLSAYLLAIAGIMISILGIMVLYRDIQA